MDRHCGKYHRRPCNICEHLTPAGIKSDQICGGHDKRPCDICEALAVHPDLDPVPVPRTIEEARAARRQARRAKRRAQMSELFRRMNLANGHWHEETTSIREALHFHQVCEGLKKRIRGHKAEGQYRSMSRLAVRHEHEFSGIRRRMRTEELYRAMKAGMLRPDLNATWP